MESTRTVRSGVLSVTIVVEQLRQAHALLTEARAATARAGHEIAEGSEIFDEGTRGSIWPQVEQIRRFGRAASDEVRLAYTELGQAQDIIDDYCMSIAGHRIGGHAGIEGGADSTAIGPGTAPDDSQSRYPEWIAERERAGAVITRRTSTG